MRSKSLKRTMFGVAAVAAVRLAGTAQAALQDRDLNGDKVVDAFYDTDLLARNARQGIEHVGSIAPQLTGPQRWFAIVRYIVDQILACVPKPNLQIASC